MSYPLSMLQHVTAIKTTYERETDAQRAHRLAHSDYLVALIETHAARGLSQSTQPLGL